MRLAKLAGHRAGSEPAADCRGRLTRRPPLVTAAVLALVTAAVPALATPLAGQAGRGGEAAAAEVQAVDDSLFPDSLPLQVGEQADYAVLFGPVRAGRMTLRVEAQDTIRGTPAYRLAMEMEGGIPFWRVDDRHVGWLAAGPYRSLRFEQVLKQGGYRRNRRWELDHEALTATRLDWNEEAEAHRPHRRERDLPMPPGALDEISYLFLIRHMDLRLGARHEFNRYFREDGNPVVIEVLRRERVRVPAGTFETIVVRPTIQTDGLFGQDGEAEVFISDDDRRIVVQVKTRMGPGEVNMYLRDSTRLDESSGGGLSESSPQD